MPIGLLLLFGATLLLERRPRIQAMALGVGRVAVPLLLVVLAAISGAELWRDTSEILNGS